MQKIDLKTPGKAHVIGVCGVGMSAAALTLRELGWQVTGSDSGFYPPVSDYLTKHNFTFNGQYAPENVPAGVDLFIIGKNAKLTPEDNAEVAEALSRNKPVLTFPEIFGQLSAGRHSIVVAGSFGKSSCTAMMIHCLLHAGKDPSYFVGAMPVGLGETSHIGQDELFVAEGDEYPTSNTDDRSKFLHLHANDVLLTSATHDHFNIFKTLDDYLNPFYELLAGLPADGKVVTCVENPEVEQYILPRLGEWAITYGIERGTWTAQNIQYGERSTFDLCKNGELVTSVEIGIYGAHNVQNCVGVAAYLLERELLTPAQVATGLATFQGVARRLINLTSKAEIPVLEGFGTSYEKARSAIEATKLHFAERRMVIIFEPHTFSWRNRDALPWYDDVFAGADEVLVYKPATQGAGTHAQLSQQEIVDRVQAAGFNVTAINTGDEGMAWVEQHVQPNDVILLLSSGELDGLIKRVPAWVEARD